MDTNNRLIRWELRMPVLAVMNLFLADAARCIVLVVTSAVLLATGMT